MQFSHSTCIVLNSNKLNTPTSVKTKAILSKELPPVFAFCPFRLYDVEVLQTLMQPVARRISITPPDRNVRCARAL